MFCCIPQANPQEEVKQFPNQVALSLEVRYRSRDSTAQVDEMFSDAVGKPQFAEIRSRCEDFDHLEVTVAAEKPGRELSPETEAERPINPLPPEVQSHVGNSVASGMITSAMDPVHAYIQNAVNCAVNYQRRGQL